METQHIYQDWDLLTQFLPEGWEEKAKTSGALKRQRKFKHPSELLRVLLIHLADGCSMRETVVRAKQGGLANVSDVALLKRLRESSEWFRWMAVKMIEQRGIRIYPPDFIQDYHVKSIDASVISEPGSTGTDYRLHYCINLFSLNCDQFIISRQSTGESLVNFKVSEDDLFIGDRVYGRLKGMKHAIDHGGQFLVRLKNKAFKMYDKYDVEINLLNAVKHLRVGQVKELLVYAIKGEHKIQLRVILLRKSEDEANKSMKKAILDQSKKQRKINPETIELHKYIILVTSLPSSIQAEQVTDLYQCRWQIELAFKRLKSILGMGHLPKKDMRSCYAWLHGKLFIAHLAQLILDEGQSFSPWGYPLKQGAQYLA